jgi:pimeloyl-ACP methyl ester carboxylesterase
VIDCSVCARLAEQAVDELPAAVMVLRNQLPTAERPITIVGGSAGGHATLVALARRQTCIAAAAVVNPAATAESVMAVTGRAHGIVEPVLLVSGEQDHPEFRADLATHCLPRRASTCPAWVIRSQRSRVCRWPRSPRMPRSWMR